MTRRFAIYFAPPPGSELEAFGRRWLGRDHVTGEAVEREAIDGLNDSDQQRISRSASHYGFHATLKAPFSLKEGRTGDELYEAANRFAHRRTAFEAPPLKLSKLSRWIALTLSAPSPEMNALAEDCVRDFEPFRAKLSDDDVERRRKSGLTPRQDEQLLAFGYPHIFEDFHFHMTLAGPLEPAEKDMVFDRLRDRSDPLEQGPLLVDAVAIYEQPDRDQPFTQTGRFPFQPKA
ncbi:MAG: DUF1045 domain-containing protein [Pseudomonadota bacterium]